MVVLFQHQRGKVPKKSTRVPGLDHQRILRSQFDADYPLYFTTGRYREHYNSGAQTRLVGVLRKAKPRPVLQVHPTAARRYAVEPGTVVTTTVFGLAEAVAPPAWTAAPVPWSRPVPVVSVAST